MSGEDELRGWKVDIQQLRYLGPVIHVHGHDDIVKQEQVGGRPTREDFCKCEEEAQPHAVLMALAVNGVRGILSRCVEIDSEVDSAALVRPKVGGEGFCFLWVQEAVEHHEPIPH